MTKQLLEEQEGMKESLDLKELESTNDPLLKMKSEDVEKKFKHDEEEKAAEEEEEDSIEKNIKLFEQT